MKVANKVIPIGNAAYKVATTTNNNDTNNSY